MKRNGDKIVVLTAYDFPFGAILEAAGVDMILVGDTLGMVVLGMPNTRSVTMEMMLHHTAAVRRGAPDTHIIGDLPHFSYETPQKAKTNARAFVDVGVDSVKLEGAHPEIVSTLLDDGIEVMGHVGLTPQTMDGFAKRGKEPHEAQKFREDAHMIEDAGAFSVVIEHVPQTLGESISSELSIPTIGIGAGPGCDGQVLVTYDMLGMYGEFVPPFVKQYGQLATSAEQACAEFGQEVRRGAFPGAEQSG